MTIQTRHNEKIPFGMTKSSLELTRSPFNDRLIPSHGEPQPQPISLTTHPSEPNAIYLSSVYSLVLVVPVLVLSKLSLGLQSTTLLSVVASSGVSSDPLGVYPVKPVTTLNSLPSPLR